MATKSFRMKLEKNHQCLHKFHSLPWKDVFRKRCFDELKKRRDAFLESVRNTDCNISLKEGKLPSSPYSEEDAIQSLIKDEWNKMKVENMASMQDEFLSWDDKHIDEYLSISSQIKADLLQEEATILAEFEKTMRLDEDRLCDTVNAVHTDEVVCPMCRQHPLMMNKAVIFCACGLRLDTEEDGLTLNNVKSNIHAGLEEHSLGCQQQPTYSVLSQGEKSSFLLMICSACDFMHVVI